jgi:hypothetical protein
MSEALPKWVMERYAKLWDKFGSKSFSHEQASEFPKEAKPTTLSLVIQELKNAGWVTVTFNPKDKRIRMYKLKDPNQAIKEMAHEKRD